MVFPAQTPVALQQLAGNGVRWLSGMPCLAACGEYRLHTAVEVEMCGDFMQTTQTHGFPAAVLDNIEHASRLPNADLGQEAMDWRRRQCQYANSPVGRACRVVTLCIRDRTATRVRRLRGGALRAPHAPSSFGCRPRQLPHTHVAACAAALLQFGEMAFDNTTIELAVLTAGEKAAPGTLKTYHKECTRAMSPAQAKAEEAAEAWCAYGMQTGGTPRARQGGWSVRAGAAIGLFELVCHRRDNMEAVRGACAPAPPSPPTAKNRVLHTASRLACTVVATVQGPKRAPPPALSVPAPHLP